MKPFAYLVVCGAPPTAAITELIETLHSDGWSVCVIPTASALDWLCIPEVERLTGFAITLDARKPAEPKRLPNADLLIVAPATFNTINKWALGINDTAVLGVLNEAVGSGLPIVASPYAKPSLAAHPAFQKSLEALAGFGVHLTVTEALRPQDPDEPFQWTAVVDLVRRVHRRP